MAPWNHEFNSNKKAICEPRWVGWEYPKSKNDPCGGCPLSRSCIGYGGAIQGKEAFNNWIDSVNELADLVQGRTVIVTDPAASS